MRPSRLRRALGAAVITLAALAAAAGRPAPGAAAPARMTGGNGARRGSDLAWIPAGRYQPLFKRPRPDVPGGPAAAPDRPVPVPAFRLARHAVTNAEYLAFVREHPEWRRSRARRLFVDEGYLRHWRGDLDFGDPALAASPVVDVSWFAARAYCSAHGRRLPTVDEWEYVAAADGRRTDATRDSAFQERLRAWYSRPTPARLDPVGSTFRNVYGVWDMHGLVWEWTSDFSSALVTGESRADASLDRALYCGSGAANAADFRDYAAFMRFALRSSLSARYCVADLGFREASSAPPPAARAGRGLR
jgi:formylglycine-generating enzyme